MYREQILLFGAGVYARKVLNKVEAEFDIEAVIDNKKNAWGSLFAERYHIISIEEYKRVYINKRILVAVERMQLYLEISQQLDKLGVNYVHVNEALCEMALKKEKDFYIDYETLNVIEKIKQQPCVFVLTAPTHSNLGDHAQSYCISIILEKSYPNHKMIMLDEGALERNFYELLYVIKRYIKESDLLFLHSGYRLTNLYMTSEYIVEMMVRLFADKKLVFLPQTIHYTDEVVKQRISKLINENVLVMCRDEQSYENAFMLFPAAKVEMYPDVVTSLIGQYDFQHERSGILMIMRAPNDGESLFLETDIQELKKKLEVIDKVEIIDTTIDEDWRIIAGDRKFYIEREIERYSKYKLVVTNRYHGTVLSMAANTPVVILPTKDHKITSGIQWFEKAKLKNYRFCSDATKIETIVSEMLDENDYSKNNTFFNDNYFVNFKLNLYRIFQGGLCVKYQ